MAGLADSEKIRVVADLEKEVSKED